MYRPEYVDHMVLPQTIREQTLDTPKRSVTPNIVDNDIAYSLFTSVEKNVGIDIRYIGEEQKVNMQT